jgi:beta-ribofuranosylaminobenzene 5'-phosphate synthase
MAVWHFKTVVEAKLIPRSRVEITGLGSELRNFIQSRLQIAGLTNVALTILESPPTHVGLGSKTSVSLACIEAACLTLGRQPTPIELISMTGRGGTSGIGINTYFSGGVIADDGHRMETGAKFYPSSMRASTSRFA